MITYQDFEQVKDLDVNGALGSFILNAIDDFKGSLEYQKAIDAQNYYEGENTTILNRIPYIFTENGKIEDFTVANNQVPTNFLNYIVTQEASTLLSNGLQTDDNIKDGLGGGKFDILLMRMALYALVDGVAWSYNYISADGKSQFKTDIWRGTEFIPFFDEMNGVLRAGIRFYQISPERPIYIELYEEDGLTKFSITKEKSTGKEVRKVNKVAEKKGYNIKIKKDILGEQIVDEFNWSVLPINPLYASEIKKSVFTTAFKAKNDLYDIILSDFGNTLEDSRDVYWVLKNYDGQNLGEFIEQYKKFKAIKVFGEDGDAKPQTIDIPYEARETALKMLEAMIYKEAMALDTSTLTGSSLNTTAIKASMDALNKKVDKFEWQVINLVENVIGLYLEWVNKPNEEYNINFIRSGLVNDTEIIDNLMKVREEISDETFYNNLPLIEDTELEIERMNLQGLRKYK